MSVTDELKAIEAILVGRPRHGGKAIISQRGELPPIILIKLPERYASNGKRDEQGRLVFFYDEPKAAE